MDRWFCAATLLSARSGADLAFGRRERLPKRAGLQRKNGGRDWEQRTRTLNQASYARYDESSSRMLGDTAQMLLDEYGADLRRLREAAEREPGREAKVARGMQGYR